MFENEPPKPKRPLVAYILMGVADIVVTVLLAVSAASPQVFFTTSLILLGVQLAAGLALIGAGGAFRPQGKVLVYGLGMAVALLLGLGLLLFAVCAGIMR